MKSVTDFFVSLKILTDEKFNISRYSRFLRKKLNC